MNMESGSPLADFQEQVFTLLADHKNLSAGDYDRLRGNAWVSMAERLSPCNLVIRHYCLLDIIERSPNRSAAIICLLKALTYYVSAAHLLLYAEGYSYWLYIKPFLKLYVARFPSVLILSELASMIDAGFQATSYLHQGLMYPAPFGDLRFQPLEMPLQDRTKMFDTVTILPVSKNGLSYFVKALPVKLNGHVPVRDSLVMIINEGPWCMERENKRPFSWYQGYEQKYPTAVGRIANTLDVRRIISLFKK